jgi:FtsP/CotA-like multicopper oxidase with cupredoxin domain
MSAAIAGWWQRRRLIVLVSAIAIAATVSLIVALSPGRATSGGDPYSVPGVVDTNPDPNIVETTLVSDEATIDIGNGVTAHAQTYNGAIPGPTFRLKVGDTVIVHYENHLAHASAIHWHGIELANGMDGTPFTQNIVEPGGTFLYKFTVTRPGLYWYHPHHHSSTNQVFKGLYGMIVVEDPNEAALRANLTIPSAADTHPIVLSDTTVCKQPPNNDTATYPPSAPHVSGASPFPAQAPPTPKGLCETAPIDENGDPAPPYAAGDIPSIQTKATSGRTNEGQTVLTNGKNVGGRAGTPSAPGALAPRADVAFGIPANATGVLTMWTEDYQRTGPNPTMYANTPTVPVMHFASTGVRARRTTSRAATRSGPSRGTSSNAHPQFADVKLVVRDGNGKYRNVSPGRERGRLERSGPRDAIVRPDRERPEG